MKFPESTSSGGLLREPENFSLFLGGPLTAIFPAGLVVGVATGTEETKMQVATGDYNKMIDQRIKEIKEHCGIK